LILKLQVYLLVNEIEFKSISVGGFDYTENQSKIYKICLKTSKIDTFDGMEDFDIDYMMRKDRNVILCGILKKPQSYRVGKFVLNLDSMKLIPFEESSHQLSCPTRKIDFMASIQDLILEKFEEISKLMIWNKNEKENFSECSLCGNGKNNLICSKCKLIIKDELLQSKENVDEKLKKVEKIHTKCLFCKNE
jgi:hypothetical protein